MKEKRKGKKPGLTIEQEPAALDTLPTDAFQIICEYADLRSVIRVASCSRCLQQLVYQGCKTLWMDLDFQKVAHKYASKITDHSLRRLLERINAREITTSLSVRGCESIKGHGLEPLRYSNVLETIDLRLGRDHDNAAGPTGLDEDFVLDVLTSMLPMLRRTRSSKFYLSRQVPAIFSLSQVKFRKETYDSKYLYATYNDGISAFFRIFHQLQKMKARDLNWLCHECQEPVANKSQREDCNFGYFACCACKTPYCQDCGDITLCNLCESAYCKECKSVCRCDSCKEFFCIECTDFIHCDLCRRRNCFECGDVSFCDSCQLSFCEGCRDVLFCDVCNSASSCEECRNISNCRSCQKDCCGDCSEVCTSCGLSTCEDCGDISYCNSCDTAYCRECRVCEQCV